MSSGAKTFKALVKDGFINVLTRLGVAGADKRLSATPVAPVELQQQDLENLYVADDIAARICDLPAKEMTRRWLTISTDNEDDREAAEEILAAAADLNVKETIKEALVWSRLHGGALVVMGINDGRTMDQPVNEEAIKEVEYLLVFDRWEARVKSTIAEIGKDFGKPETYELMPQAFATVTGAVTGMSLKSPIVHADRVMRFDGALTPKRRKIQNQGWNDSVLTRVYEVIRDYSSSYAGVFVATQTLSQTFYKLKGLAAMLANDQDELVLKRLQLIDYSRSATRAVPLDLDEEMGTLDQKLETVDKVLGKLDERLAQAVGWPITVLMGRSPAGMNATGTSDLEIFYDSIEAEQQRALSPPLERLFLYLQLSSEVRPAARSSTRGRSTTTRCGKRARSRRQRRG